MGRCTLIKKGTILNPPVDQRRDPIPKVPSVVVRFAWLILILEVPYLCLRTVNMCFTGLAFSNGAIGTIRHVLTVGSLCFPSRKLNLLLLIQMTVHETRTASVDTSYRGVVIAFGRPLYMYEVSSETREFAIINMRNELKSANFCSIAMFHDVYQRMPSCWIQ